MSLRDSAKRYATPSSRHTHHSLHSQVAKKLVRGDYKSGRVKDPTAKISSNHEKTIKKYVKEYMDKAVKKKEEREKQKSTPNGAQSSSKDENSPGTPNPAPKDEDVEWTNDMLDASPVDSTSDHKRKREEDAALASPKRTRTHSEDVRSAPPPPPPPATSEREEQILLESADAELLSRGKAGRLDGNASPMQLATPPTNGSGSGSRPVNGDGGHQ